MRINKSLSFILESVLVIYKSALTIIWLTEQLVFNKTEANKVELQMALESLKWWANMSLALLAAEDFKEEECKSND